MLHTPIDNNWTMGYAFNIVDGGELKEKSGPQELELIRHWINLSRSKISPEGGRYPCLAMQFRPKGAFKRSVEWARWQDQGFARKAWDKEYAASTEADDEGGVNEDEYVSEGSICPDCGQSKLQENHEHGEFFCPICHFSQMKKFDFEILNADDFFGLGTQKVLEKGGVFTGPNQKVKESFYTEIVPSFAQFEEFKEFVDQNKDGLESIFEWIGMRLPCPTGGEGRLAREGDAWRPWVVNEGQTKHGYAHLALAGLIWLWRWEKILDNRLLKDSHKILLRKGLAGLDNPWGPRDVLFVVEILRLMSFEHNQVFEWADVLR